MSRSIFDYRQRMIRVNDATYVLTPIDKLFTNDIFYIKKRGVYTQDVKGPYTFALVSGSRVTSIRGKAWLEIWMSG